ncbi:MAG: transglycosylase SLT domain-containing protein [Candidatus Omnitrophica bacterium]|nr:transglycosylase SLT domain-containing protein [Candidatus Omnitrophota bacterium]
MKKFIIYLIKLLFLFFLLIVFWKQVKQERKFSEFEKKYSLFIDKQIQNDEFIVKRIEYVNKYVKDKIIAYRILKAVSNYSKIFNIDADLVLSLIEHESRFDTSAVSYKGAIGLMQILPETGEVVARLLNKVDYNLFGLEDNIEIGVCFLALLLKYNTLENALRKYYAGGLWRINLADKYQKEVLNKYVSLKNSILVE